MFNVRNSPHGTWPQQLMLDSLKCNIPEIHENYGHSLAPAFCLLSCSHALMLSCSSLIKRGLLVIVLKHYQILVLFCVHFASIRYDPVWLWLMISSVGSSSVPFSSRIKLQGPFVCVCHMRTRTQNFGVNSNIAMNTHAQAHPKFWSKFQPSYENIKLMNLSHRRDLTRVFFPKLIYWI